MLFNSKAFVKEFSYFQTREFKLSQTPTPRLELHAMQLQMRWTTGQMHSSNTNYILGVKCIDGLSSRNHSIKIRNGSYFDLICYKR